MKDADRTLPQLSGELALAMTIGDAAREAELWRELRRRGVNARFEEGEVRQGMEDRD